MERDWGRFCVLDDGGPHGRAVHTHLDRDGEFRTYRGDTCTSIERITTVPPHRHVVARAYARPERKAGMRAVGYVCTECGRFWFSKATRPDLVKRGPKYRVRVD